MKRNIISNGHESAGLEHNKALSAIFMHMADCYRYLGKDERFRAIAYDTAAKTLGNMSEPVDAYGRDIRKLDELKGVGESIAEKIIEFLDTGKIQTFEKLKQQVPYELLDLMEIEGFGPATIRAIHDTLHVNTKAELAAAAEQGKLETIRGFGMKKIQPLLQVLKLKKETHQRLPLITASRIGNDLLKAINRISYVHKAVLAGSIRRQKDTIGDIDIVITADQRNWKKIVDGFTSLPQVKSILASGKTKASVILKTHDVQADLRIVHDHEYGSALFYFTGSREHNIQLRIMAKKKGWKINEYGVFDLKTNKRLAGETEESIYALFGLPYIPPEKRLGKDELKAAMDTKNKTNYIQASREKTAM